jgi:hypothetical protein
MATLYATNPLTGTAWSDNVPIYKPVGSGVVCAAIGTYELLANPTANDVIRFCKVPRGAIVFAGWLTGDDLDTGSETLDIDIGWEANGSDVADTDGFGNMGVLNGATVTNVIPVAGILRTLQGVLLTEGTKTLAAETWISGLVIATAAATGTGTISVKVLYYMP